MTTYTIDNENSITALGSQQADFEGEIFASQQELADLAAKWPADRLVEVWNGIPGLTPVKKFTNRTSAVSRIWKAIQNLDGGGQEETVTTAPKRANKAKVAAKAGKKAKTAAKAKPAKAAKGKTRQGWRQASRSPRRPQKGHGPGPSPAEGRRDARADHEGDRLAGAQRTRIHQRRAGQENGAYDSVRREDGERVYSIA